MRKAGNIEPAPPFFRVFRAFRGSNSLMLYIIAGAENPNHESITTYNEVIMGMLSLCFLSSCFPRFNFTFKMSGEILVLDDKFILSFCEVLIFTVITIVTAGLLALYFAPHVLKSWRIK